jgi:hypothetical protein
LTPRAWLDVRGCLRIIWNKAVLHENYATKPEHAVHKEAGQLAGESRGFIASYSVFFHLAAVHLLVTQFQHYRQNRTCFEYPPYWQQHIEVVIVGLLVS